MSDVTAYKYDAVRRAVGVIGPDPDGADAPGNAAARLTYDDKGRLTVSEQGTTAGHSHTAWGAFSPASKVETAYDGGGRKLTETLKSGSRAYALSQYSYDARGRLDCAAVRMKPAESDRQANGAGRKSVPLVRNLTHATSYRRLVALCLTAPPSGNPQMAAPPEMLPVPPVLL